LQSLFSSKQRKFGDRKSLGKPRKSFFGVIGANMGCKLFVALQLEVAHHFIDR